MAETTISGLPAALRMLQTMTVPVDTRDPVTQTTTTEHVTLSQILALFATIGNIPPTGVANVWPTDQIPTGYLELNGQSFDKLTYPELGLVFPSGILPDWRGRVAKHAPAGRNAGQTEEDQIKAHNHTITVNSTDLGTKTTDTAGNHSHSVYARRDKATGGIYATYGSGAGNGSTSMSTGGNHNHTVSIGSHSHSASCSTTGGTENTVKGVFVRYIVRAK